MKIVVAAMALSLTVGCASREVRESKRMEGKFELGEPGSGWSKVKTGGADKAFRNRDLRAVIYADSNCGVRFEDAPLLDLAEHMSRGVRVQEFDTTESLTLDGRDALIGRVQGTLDGVPVELGTAIVKKDFCVYDIVLIGPRGASFETAWADYRVVVEGFRTTS